MASSVIVIGGGFSGLACATLLAERGVKVTLLEGRQMLGGRAFSYPDPDNGEVVDNGQHLFMSCYFETIRFLERIGTRDLLHFQPRLKVSFLDASHGKSQLACLPLPAPLHLMSGLLGLSHLSFADRFRARHVWNALKDPVWNETTLDQITVEQWLVRLRQSPRARTQFWDLIAIACLNEEASRAAALSFAAVLRQAFFGGPLDSRLGYSTVGLSRLYTEAAQRYIESHGGEVRLKTPVERMVIDKNQVREILLRGGDALIAESYVSTLPPQNLVRLFSENYLNETPYFGNCRKLTNAPIISVNLWFESPIVSDALIGFLNTQTHWLFNKASLLKKEKVSPGYVSLVISGAHAFMSWDKTDILSLCLEEIRRLVPTSRGVSLKHARVAVEANATLSPVPGTQVFRPTTESPLRNLALAGDWVRTGLPATIESAVLSGHQAAAFLLDEEITEDPRRMGGVPVRSRVFSMPKQPAGGLIV